MNQLHGPNSSAALNGDLGDQRKYLFEDLFVTEDMIPFQPMVIVLDGLDNCGDDRSSQTALARSLVALATSLPWIKIVISSRDRPDLRAVFNKRCHLVDIKTDTHVRDDIRLYVQSRIKDTASFPPDGLRCNETDIGRLVSKADGLFEWCSVVFRYLEDCVDPAHDLQELLAGRGVADALPGLFALYDDVLAFRFSSSKDICALREILGVIFVSSATQPLSVTSIARFLPSHGLSTVRRMIQLLSPVLYCAQGEVVRAHHLSFHDYLESKFDTAAEGWPSLSDVHSDMAIACLGIMHQELRFNICNLTDSSVLNKDVPDLGTRIARCLSPELLYGSSFWMTHVASATTPGLDSGGDAKVCALVRGLVCDRRVLYWLEVLSLAGRAEQSITILRQCGRHFAVSTGVPRCVRI